MSTGMLPVEGGFFSYEKGERGAPAFLRKYKRQDHAGLIAKELDQV
jgi:hypothetical protein